MTQYNTHLHRFGEWGYCGYHDERRLTVSQIPPRAILCRFMCLFTMTLGLLGLHMACVSTPDQTDWIRIGVTTKDEVIARYGQPDLLMAVPDGETVTYRPAGSGASVPRLEIPTAQVGPFGAATTRMQPIEPGLGARDWSTEAKEPLRRELRIRYDVRGLVQELSVP